MVEVTIGIKLYSCQFPKRSYLDVVTSIDDDIRAWTKVGMDSSVAEADNDEAVNLDSRAGTPQAYERR